MKKIAFFGGTFDPIHFGHIGLALHLLEARHLDQVLFCPAYQSPFKEHHPPIASAEHRLSMLALALQDVPQFQSCRLEIDRKGISYTVETLRELHTIYGKRVEWSLILSYDSLESFHQWKEPEEIVALAAPLVGVRGHAAYIPPSPVKQALERGFIKTPRMDISSTDIRQRLNRRLYCGHLVPAKSLDYIEREGLYL